MNDKSRVWEAVRRALGRLASHVSVQHVLPSDLMPRIGLRGADTLTPPPARAGSREGDWLPTAIVGGQSVPQALSGTRDGDWKPAARLAETAAALSLPRCWAMPIVQNAPCRSESADLLLPAFVVRLPEMFLALPSAPVSVRAASLPAPPVPRVLREWDVALPKSRALRLPRVAVPRVRVGDDTVLGRMPLSRLGLMPPDGTPFASAFVSQSLRLAEAVQAAPDDVLLLGIYPGVPILAVRRIVVAEEGRTLRLWLKPEVLRGRNGTKLITLLVGRRISSGKMLQAVL